MLVPRAYRMHITEVVLSRFQLMLTLTLELARMPLPFQNDLVSIISTNGNKHVKLALFFTRSCYQNCSPALKSKLRQQGGVMQEDSGPQVCYWLAEARCRDSGINDACLMFTTRPELIRHMLECSELTAK